MAAFKHIETWIGWFLDDDLKEEVCGDLQEAYERRKALKGKFFANLFLIMEVLLSVRLTNKKVSKLKLKQHMFLFNYLKVGFRFIWKTRTYSSINIIGLALGLTMAGYAWLFVSDQYSYDTYHQDAANVYRIGFLIDFKGDIEREGGASFIMGEEFKKRIPAIKASTQIKAGYPLLKRANETVDLVIHFANADLFKMLDFDFHFGSPASFQDPSEAFVSESFYQSLDNKETMELIFNGQPYTFQITGVYKDVPSNSSFRPRVIIPTSFYPNIVPERRLNTWFDINMNVLVQLNPNADKTMVEDQLTEIIQQEEDELKASMFLQPLTEIHTDTALSSGNGLIGTIKKDILNVLLYTGLLCLIISTINFSIFSQGNYLKRIKEVGIRKTIGANRNLIFWQFITEVSLNVAIALVLSLLLQLLLLPFFSEYIDQVYTPGVLLNYQYLAGIALLGILAVLFSGLFPAFYLAKLHILSSLKGYQFLANKRSITKVFLSFQAALSIFMLIVTLSAHRQLDYMLSFDLGYDDENLLFANTHPGDQETILKQELLKIPGVRQVSYNSGYNGTRLRGEFDKIMVRHLHVDPDFVQMTDLQLLKGRNLDPRITSDQTDAVLINEQLAAQLNFDNPIGETLPFSYGDLKDPKIIGVVSDYHFQSPKYANQPLVIYLAPIYPFQYLFVKTENMSPQIVDQIAEAYNEAYAPFTFDYHWMKDYNAIRLATENKVSKASMVGSILAIVLSALGLLGVLGTSIEKRLKALSIHKINGATTGNLYQIFFRSYAPWLVIGLLIGIYPAYQMVENMLANYANRIEVSSWQFVIAVVLCLAVFILVMLAQLNRLNRLNPVKFLHDE